MRFQCDWFAKSILGLTTEQQTMRSMMTLALAFGNFSVFTGMMALDWKRFQITKCKKKKYIDDKSSRFVLKSFVADISHRYFTGMKSLESITMPGLSRYVKAFMGVLTAFLLFMTGFIHFKCHQIMIILSRPHTDCYFNISC